MKCSNCGLVNFAKNIECSRCSAELGGQMPSQEPKSSFRRKILTRGLTLIAVCLFVLAGFYLSLIGSARSLAYQDKLVVNEAINVLKQKGFTGEAFLLENITAFRREDNWLNASVEKENAYAATNFPFEIITIYPDFFVLPADSTERAAILLHEALHLKGKDEHDAYQFVWKNRERLGWTSEKYRGSPLWSNIRLQTKDHVPTLFVCEGREQNDCTEPVR